MALKIRWLGRVFFVLVAVAMIWPASPGHAVASERAIVDNAVRLLSATEVGATFEVRVPRDRLQVEAVSSGGQEMSKVSIPGWSTTGRAGAPALPMVVATLGVPHGAEVTLSVGPGAPALLALPAPVAAVPALSPEWSEPAPGVLSQGLPTLGFENQPDPEIYGSDQAYPGPLAAIVSDRTVNGQRVIGVAAYPVQYQPDSVLLVVYEDLEIQIAFEGGTGGDAEGFAAQPGSADDAGRLGRGVLNELAAEAWVQGTAAPAGTLAAPWLPPDPGYRVSVEHAGIYKLTYGDLSGAGVLDTNPDPRTFRLYNKGQEVAIHVEGEGDGQFGVDDYVLFYGEAADSKYTPYNVYWLTYAPTVAGDERRMPDRDGTPDPAGGTSPVGHNDVLHREENHYYVTILDGDQDLERFVWSYVYAPSIPQWSHSFSLAGPATGTAMLTVAMFGGNIRDSYADPHHTVVTLNGVELENVVWDGIEWYVMSEPLDQSILKTSPEVNTLVVSSPNDQGESYDLVYIDWATLEFVNSFTAVDDQLRFHYDTPGIWTYAIEGFTTDDAIVFDITDPSSVARITGGGQIAANPAAYSFVDEVAAGAATDYIVLTPAAFRSPAGIELDTPSDLGAVTGADWVVVTHSLFSGAAARLTAHRAAQGLVAFQVDVQDVYDQFGYGIEGAYPIHDFLEYTFYNWQPRPVYVVLFGDGSADPKDHEKRGSVSFIPPYLAPVDPWIVETAADNRYVAFTDTGTYPLPDMMLGRLAVDTEHQANVVVNKIIDYELAPEPGDWKESVLFVADNDDPGIAFTDYSDDIINCCLPASYQYERVYYLDTHPTSGGAKADILANITSGQFIVNYVGHSSVTTWAGESLFGVGDLGSLGNGGKLPVMLPMTCYDGYYHGLYSSSLAESIVRIEGKGAVASWSGTGLGVAQGHDELNRGFFDALFKDGKRTIGEATMAGLQRLADGGTHLDLLDTYLLFGDPALQLTQAPTSVELASFEAIAKGGQAVMLRWRTASEAGVLGFDLFRQDARGTVQLNDGLIPSRAPGTAMGAAYEWLDGPLPAGEHLYWLEIIDQTGGRTRHGPAEAVLAEYRLLLPFVSR